jgi:hypothetical protein
MTRPWFITVFVVSGFLASLIVATAGPALGSCASLYRACTTGCNGANQCVHNCINAYASCNAQQGISLGPPKNQPTRHFPQKAKMGWSPLTPFGR